MPQIGLFPLGIVLLPGERIPLHIFEERYKELIRECLSDEREFGLVYGEDDAVREIGTRARVVEVLQVFDDGRLNIVVEGADRFRVVRLTAGRSFQTAHVESFTDEDADSPAEQRERVVELYRRLAEAAGGDPELDVSSPRLAFEVAGRIAFDAEVKQKLLELRSERARLEMLAPLLEKALQTVEVAREQRQRASQNGRVGP